MQTQQLQQLTVAALEDLKANDISVLDVTHLTTITDTMVICSARSNRHLKSLADNVVEKVKTEGGRPLGKTGDLNSGWILIDLGDVVVHVMSPETREFYNLEKLWS